MKIAHIIPTFLPSIGGAEICVHNVASKQIELGHDVTLYLPWILYFKNRKNNFKYKIKPIPVYNWMYSFKNVRLNFLFLSIYFKMVQSINKYDIWHATQSFPAGYYLLSLKGRVPIFLTTQGADIQKIPNLNYGFRLNSKLESMIEKTVRNFDGLAAISDSVIADYLELNVNPEKIFDIPNGVDINRFKLKNKNELRKKYNLPLEKKIILTVGRNHPKKGFKYIPDIIESLINKHVDFLWIIIGRNNSDLLKSLASDISETIIVIEELGNDNSNYNLPPDKLLDYYYMSDIFCFPSLVETFGIVLVEAMAAGLPVITTDAPGCRDVVINNEVGFNVKEGKWNEMADKISLLIKDENIYKKFAINARDTALQYDWGRIADQYIEAYRSTINNQNI